MSGIWCLFFSLFSNFVNAVLAIKTLIRCSKVVKDLSTFSTALSTAPTKTTSLPSLATSCLIFHLVQSSLCGSATGFELSFSHPKNLLCFEKTKVCIQKRFNMPK